MATKQQKKELVETLKFTPRTYTVRVHGYGGEIAMGRIKTETVDYFKKHYIDVDNYSTNSACEGDDDYIDVPEDLQPFTQGSWYDCDNIEHNSGAEFGGAYLTVDDENGNTVFEEDLGFNLEDLGCEVESFCDEEIENYCDNETAVFVGQSIEKGTFFEADLDLKMPFDPSKFKFTYSEVAGWKILNTVEYDSEELDGSNGYDTTGKSSEYYFYYRNKEGDVETYNTPEYPEHQNGSNYYAEDWEQVEFKFGKRNRPSIKGWYSCVWKDWGTSYGQLFWDGGNWVDYEYGKPRIIEGVERWTGLYWDTADLANQPEKKPRKKKDAKPLTAKQVHPYPHKCNGVWPEELGLIEPETDQGLTSFINAVNAEVSAREESWADSSVKPPAKGEYECEFETVVWPLGKVRTAEWTGRSWKENGKKAIVVRWRNINTEVEVE